MHAHPSWVALICARWGMHAGLKIVCHASQLPWLNQMQHCFLLFVLFTQEFISSIANPHFWQSPHEQRLHYIHQLVKAPCKIQVTVMH